MADRADNARPGNDVEDDEEEELEETVDNNAKSFILLSVNHLLDLQNRKRCSSLRHRH